MAKFYQLRVSLDEIEPEIWRRVVVPSDITLDRLHDVIQICMGWNDSHLHRFMIDGQEYTDYFDELDEGHEEFEALYALGDLVKTKGTEFPGFEEFRRIMADPADLECGSRNG